MVRPAAQRVSRRDRVRRGSGHPDRRHRVVPPQLAEYRPVRLPVTVETVLTVLAVFASGCISVVSCAAWRAYRAEKAD